VQCAEGSHESIVVGVATIFGRTVGASTNDYSSTTHIDRGFLCVEDKPLLFTARIELVLEVKRRTLKACAEDEEAMKEMYIVIGCQ
jgi:hypothetical protein